MDEKHEKKVPKICLEIVFFSLRDCSRPFFYLVTSGASKAAAKLTKSQLKTFVMSRCRYRKDAIRPRAA